ncbi:hypothetical protein M2306_000661 [Myroides gitamensis]|nr:hypothetical protein [Myroides odoratus]MDH6599967.1 hypothetical protein [Myroides gitamensis]
MTAFFLFTVDCTLLTVNKKSHIFDVAFLYLNLGLT